MTFTARLTLSEFKGINLESVLQAHSRTFCLMMLAFYVVGQPPVAIEEWTAEVMALPERKRLKWKGHILHVKGELSLVRWRPDGFVCYLNQAEKATAIKQKCILPADGWAPIYAFGDMISLEQTRCCYGEAAAQLYVQHQGEKPIRTGTFTYEDHGMEAYLNEGNARRIQLHTGNHYRNHKISIPVSPGQPLRG